MKPYLKIILACLIILDALAWHAIASDSSGKRLELHFFAVGQGDSEMVVMPGNVKMLVDGGPDNGKAARQVDAALRGHDRYIDMIMLSHAELDHFGGLLDVLRNHDIGVVLYNGRGNDSERFRELARVIKEKNIPVVALAEGDSIRYADNVIDIVSAHGKNKNESGLVAKFTGGGISALFASDIGKDTERRLTQEKNIRADILKIPHHGSKFSSTEEFLKIIRPKVAVIEVGKNSYGHPAKMVLDRIAQVGAQIFRTDADGAVRLVVENGIIRQGKEK